MQQLKVVAQIMDSQSLNRKYFFEMSDIQGLVSDLKASALVLRDALKKPATTDSYKMVCGLMEEFKAAKALLSKRASELAEKDDHEYTDVIFDALEYSSELEQQFKTWSDAFNSDTRSVSSKAGTSAVPPPPPPPPVSSFSVASELPFEVSKTNSNLDLDESTKKIKKKKSKKESLDSMDFGIEWDAFAAPPEIPPVVAVTPPATSTPVVTAQPTPPPVTPPTVAAQAAPQTVATPGWPLRGRVRIFLPWADVGPLLCENPQAGEEARRARMESFLTQSLAKSCNFAESRITATIRSTQ